MDNARKGEIALLYLKHKVGRDGIRLGPDLRRDVGNTAKAIGAPFEEAMEFVEEMTREMVDRLFANKHDPSKIEIIQL